MNSWRETQPTCGGQLHTQSLITVFDKTMHERAVKLASLPDLIRGYEDIKLANVARFRAEVKTLGF